MGIDGIQFKEDRMQDIVTALEAANFNVIVTKRILQIDHKIQSLIPNLDTEAEYFVHDIVVTHETHRLKIPYYKNDEPEVWYEIHLPIQNLWSLKPNRELRKFQADVIAVVKSVVRNELVR